MIFLACLLALCGAAPWETKPTQFVPIPVGRRGLSTTDGFRLLPVGRRGEGAPTHWPPPVGRRGEGKPTWPAPPVGRKKNVIEKV